MRIYKERYTDKEGKRRKTTKWYIDFTDQRGKRHRLPGFNEKRLTQKFADNIEALVSCKIAGQSLDKNMQTWIESLPEKVLMKLISIELIDGQRAESGKLLMEHLDDYKDVLTAKGKSDTHINGTISRIKAVSKEQGFAYIRDVRAADVVKYLGKLRLEDKSPTTRNHYLTAIKMFMNWLKDERRISENPIAHLKKEKAQPEKRGALTSDQFNLLIHHVSAEGKVERKNTGKERGMLYLMAGLTGLRRGELISLLWSDLEIKKTYSCVNLDSERTKNSEDISQPLPPQAAKLFKRWKEKRGCKDEDKVFPNFTRHCRPSEWIKADLKAAGLPTEDYMGNKIDFHSLRNSYISFLADSNTPPKVIQKLARHSSIDLTMNIYARPTLSKEKAAIESLPKLDTEKKRSQSDDTSNQKGNRRTA